MQHRALARAGPAANAGHKIRRIQQVEDRRFLFIAQPLPPDRPPLIEPDFLVLAHPVPDQVDHPFLFGEHLGGRDVALALDLVANERWPPQRFSDLFQA